MWLLFVRSHLCSTRRGVFPRGLFVDNIIEAMSAELKEECDYELEARNQTRFRPVCSSSSGGGSCNGSSSSVCVCVCCC